MFFKTELEKNNGKLKKLLTKARDKDSRESYEAARGLVFLRKADIKTDVDGYSVLHAAIKYDDTSAILHLCSEGADPDKDGIIGTRPAEYSRGTINVYSIPVSMCFAKHKHGDASANIVDQLTALFEGGANFLDKEFLERIFAHNKFSDLAVKCIEKYGVEKILKTEVLNSATVYINAPSLKALLEKGLDPNITDISNIPLLMRVYLIEAQKELLKFNPKIDAQDDTGRTALIRKASTEYGSAFLSAHCCASVLLDHGANPDIQDVKGNTAMHMAALNGNFLMVKLLLGRGADSDIKNSEGKKARDCAKDIQTQNLIDDYQREGKAEKKDPMVITLSREVEGGFTLTEIFNFTDRERITHLAKSGEAPAMTRQKFDDVANQKESLKPAWEEHARRGGTLPESVIWPYGKRSVHLEGLAEAVALKRRSSL